VKAREGNISEVGGMVGGLRLEAGRKELKAERGKEISRPRLVAA